MRNASISQGRDAGMLKLVYATTANYLMYLTYEPSTVTKIHINDKTLRICTQLKKMKE